MIIIWCSLNKPLMTKVKTSFYTWRKIKNNKVSKVKSTFHQQNARNQSLTQYRIDKFHNFNKISKFQKIRMILLIKIVNKLKTKWTWIPHSKVQFHFYLEAVSFKKPFTEASSQIPSKYFSRMHLSISS